MCAKIEEKYYHVNYNNHEVCVSESKCKLDQGDGTCTDIRECKNNANSGIMYANVTSEPPLCIDVTEGQCNSTEYTTVVIGNQHLCIPYVKLSLDLTDENLQRQSCREMFRGLLWAPDEVCMLHKRNLRDFEKYVRDTSSNVTNAEEILGYYKQIPKLVRASKNLYVGVLIGDDIDSTESSNIKLHIRADITAEYNSDLGTQYVERTNGNNIEYIGEYYYKEAGDSPQTRRI